MGINDSYYYKDASGRWQRVPGKRVSHCNLSKTRNTNNIESEDTKIRRDIHVIIDKMAKDNKGTVEIEVILTNKYPSYSEYIIKMINQYFAKLNRNKIKKVLDTEKGEER